MILMFRFILGLYATLINALYCTGVHIGCFKINLSFKIWVEVSWDFKLNLMLIDFCFIIEIVPLYLSLLIDAASRAGHKFSALTLYMKMLATFFTCLLKRLFFTHALKRWKFSTCKIPRRWFFFKDSLGCNV